MTRPGLRDAVMRFEGGIAVGFGVLAAIAAASLWAGTEGPITHLVYRIEEATDADAGIVRAWLEVHGAADSSVQRRGDRLEIVVPPGDSPLVEPLRAWIADTRAVRFLVALSEADTPRYDAYWEASAEGTKPGIEPQGEDRERWPHGLRWTRCKSITGEWGGTDYRRGTDPSWILCVEDPHAVTGRALEAVEVHRDYAHSRDADAEAAFVVVVRVREEDREALRRVTAANLERHYAMVLGDVAIYAPVLRSELSDAFQISGPLSREKARELADHLLASGFSARPEPVEAEAPAD